METLNILKIDNDTDLEEQQEKNVIHEQNEEQLEENSVEKVQMIKKVNKIEKNKRDEEPDKQITKYLREKDLSENLIKTLINNGLTDENVRFLKTLGLTVKDIDNLRNLWLTKIEVKKDSDSTKSASSSDESSNGLLHLSSSDYLKKVLSKPLIQALREIVAKKPADPVEYLGHWLLHFKICEERSMKQKERDLEFSISKEKLELKHQIEEKEDFPIERKEEEKLGEDFLIERKEEEELGEYFL